MKPSPAVSSFDSCYQLLGKIGLDTDKTYVWYEQIDEKSEL